MLLDPADWSLASHADAVIVATDRRARVAHEHRDPRVGARAANRSARDRTRGAGPARGPARRAGAGARAAGSRERLSPACTRSPRGRTRRSPTATATASCTGRCASSPGASPPSRCTCTWPSPIPKARCCALNRLRSHLPLLLALSANSPFWQGRETGLASARTPLFQAFPRVGIPRAFLRLRGLREHDRPAAALRSLSRAHVPVVGRSPAAALRNDRGQDHGRPDHGRRLGGARRRSCSASCASRPPRARVPTRRSTCRRCSPRTAFSPPATAPRRA